LHFTFICDISAEGRAAKAFFNNVPDLAGAIHKMIEENSEYKKKMEEVVRERTVLLKQDLLSHAREMGGRRIIVIERSVDPQMLRNAAFMLQNETENLVVAAAYEAGGKPQLLLMYSADLVKAGKNAQADVKEAAKCIQGGGGGQPGLATAGGKNLAGLGDALEKLIASATK
jgi:alanyl-tRNA synthetase